MMRKLALGLIFAASMAAPAHASSLPPADFGGRGQVGLGFGAGLGWQGAGSVALDVPVMNDLAIGGSLNRTLIGGTTYDVRAMYRFIEESRETPAIVGLVGLWGSTGGTAADPRFTSGAPVAPAIGFGLAYSPLDRLDLRLNLAYSPFYNYGSELLYFIGGHPGSGVEVAWRLTPDISVTAGLNGNGDVLGLAYRF